MERLQGTAQKVLPHPSFVYCAQYHPTAQNLVVTGGYDSLVRVWRLDVDDVNGQLLQEFEGHNSFINSVCFDSEGIVFLNVVCKPDHKTGNLSMLCTSHPVHAEIGPQPTATLQHEIRTDAISQRIIRLK